RTKQASAASQDLDLYIHREVHLDGKPTLGGIEMPACISGGPNAEEYCAIENPLPGQYVVTVHNFGGSRDGVDAHVLEVALVTAETTDLSVINPGRLDPGEEVVLAARLERDMQEGDEAIGTLALGTRPDAPRNIGSMPVYLRRGVDEVRMSGPAQVALGAGTATVDIEIAPNLAGIARTLHISLPVPAPLEVVDVTAGGVLANGGVSWQIERAVNAPALLLRVVLDVSAVAQYSEFPLTARHHVSAAGASTQDEE